MENKLKGGVEYYTYIWHANPSACEKCLKMDGKLFKDEKDIPDLLHPNCQCWVDKLDSGKNTYQSAPNENKKDEIEVLIGDTKSLKDEINEALNNMKDFWGKNSDWQIKSLINSYANDLNNADSVLLSFLNELYNLMAQDFVSSNTIETMQKRYFEYENYYQNILKCFDREIEKARKFKENDFSKDIKKHAELKEIMDYCHEKRTKLPDGYKKIDDIHDKKTSLDVKIFTNDNEVILSFPGSDLKSRDLKQDAIDIPFKKINPQLNKAQEVLDKVKNNPELKNKKIILSGYSLGGNTAAQLGAENNIDTVTFEPYYGIDEMIQKRADEKNEVIEVYPEKITNYYHQNDPVKNANKNGHIGTTYETYGNIPENNTIPAVLKNEIDNKAVIVPHFLDNLGNAFERSIEPVYINMRSIYYPNPFPTKMNKQKHQL